MPEDIANNYFSMKSGYSSGMWIFESLDRYPESVKTGSEIFADYLCIGASCWIHDLRHNETVERLNINGGGEYTPDEMIAERERYINIRLNE